MAVSGDELHELEARQDPRLLRALDVVAPGTPLREGIDNIVYSRTGGLIVIGEPEEISFLFSGGIKLDVDYSPALLYQVAKMDGAIVLDPEARKIAWANGQLMPDPTILSMETGTRHRTAERVSKQTNALVIAISSRRDVVSLYIEDIKYILQDIPTVLSKANQGLATLEKYRARLDQVASRLTALDFGRLAELLGYDRKTNTLNFPVAPRGYRALFAVPRLPRLVAQKVVNHFGDLDALLGASDGDLEAVEGVGEARAKE